MANLDTLLTDTMLGKAAPDPVWRETWAPFPVTEPTPKPEAEEEEVYWRNPIWNFNSPTFAGAGVQVADVSCKVRSMNYMKMRVLDLIEWGPVVVRSDEIGGDVSLPLTQQFLLRSRYVKEGVINGSDTGYWQLPARTDQSFEMVFGYELASLADSPSPLLSSEPTPLSTEDLTSDQFMPGDEAAVSPAEPGSDVLSTLRTRPLRVVVVVSLVCCKERYDFVPGNVLGAGRLYPLLMIVANSALEKAVGSVKLARPSNTAHTKMAGELMTSKINSAFFTDRNNSPDSVIPPLPYWSNIFDYYWVDPPASSYTMVKSSDRSPGETIPNGVTVHERSSVLGSEESFDRDVKKVSGQGEFDNIHIAPKMVASKQVQEGNDDLTGLDAVAMAPFCMHDCFHMHWRWSNDFTDKYNRGWVGQSPFAMAGAPLVPGNQEVSLQLLSPVSFRYTATALNPFAGDWQIIMHHGGAYALSVNELGNIAKTAVLAKASADRIYILGGAGTWMSFYWWLRYERSSWRGRQFERLTWTPKQFAALRGVGGAAAAAP